MVLRAAGLAAFSALLGGAIALAARRRPNVLERTRTFAFAAAAGVVVFHLLPEVLPGQGLVALLYVGAGFALPWILEASSRLFGPGLLQGRGFSNLRVAAEVGFGALIFHSLAEGLALVAALARPRGGMDLEVALVAHHAPLTAAVVLPFLDLKGARSAAVRAAAIAAAGALGAALSGALPGLSDGALLRKATAVTAGALLHVVFDEIREQRFGSGWERAADLGACAVGLLVAGVGVALHLREAAPAVEFVRVFAGLSLACAPALLLGAVAAALLQWPPLQRMDALLLAAFLLGPLAALLLAIGFLANPPPPEPRTGVEAPLLAAIRERVPAILALLIVAVGLEVLVPSLEPHSGAVLLCLMAGLALGARLDEAGAIAIAAVLMRKGLPGGFAVTLLLVGPTMRHPTLKRILASSIAALGAFWLSETLSGAARGLGNLREPIAAQVAGSPLGAAAASVLVALALATLWSAGARGWFAPLRHGPRAA